MSVGCDRPERTVHPLSAHIGAACRQVLAKKPRFDLFGESLVKVQRRQKRKMKDEPIMKPGEAVEAEKNHKTNAKIWQET
jgi:hypothetical protein